MTPDEIISELSTYKFSSVFNPYAELCPAFDKPNAVHIRRENLKCYLQSMFALGVSTVWIGRDFGYRGGRRTGIALTDEFHLDLLKRRLSASTIAKATKSDSMKERTASEVWKVIGSLSHLPLLWNAFPFHPFEDGNPFSNRAHTRGEVLQCDDFLFRFLSAVRAKRIIALGADAKKAILRIGLDCTLVRHPSYGGQIEFAKGIRKLHQ